MNGIPVTVGPRDVEARCSLEDCHDRQVGAAPTPQRDARHTVEAHVVQGGISKHVVPLPDSSSAIARDLRRVPIHSDYWYPLWPGRDGTRSTNAPVVYVTESSVQ